MNVSETYLNQNTIFKNKTFGMDPVVSFQVCTQIRISKHTKKAKL